MAHDFLFFSRGPFQGDAHVLDGHVDLQLREVLALLAAVGTKVALALDRVLLPGCRSGLLMLLGHVLLQHRHIHHLQEDNLLRQARV